MFIGNRPRARKSRLGFLLGAIVTMLALAACGSSSSDSSSGSSASAQSILQKTFAGASNVKSGVLGFTLSVKPTGSSTLTTPIVLSLAGPFQSRGTRKVPASNFTVGISALGRRGTLGLISTGTAGYVTLQGSDYQLPASQFQQLQSSLSSVAPSGSSGGLGTLGINPQHWLQSPRVTGNETLGGADTTHIRAGVNLAVLLSDLNTFLSKNAGAAAGKAGIPTTIPPATRQKLAASVKNATVDIWTGATDRILRRLTVGLTVPVTGQTSSAFGGMTSAGIGLTIQYADINKPQTITAPTHVLPYSQFTTKLRGVLQAVEGGLGSSTSSGSASSSGSGTATAPAAGTTSSGSASSTNVQKYSKCIEQAGQDVSKMQKCAPLLNGQ